MNGASPRVELVVDELVLRGVRPEDGPAVAAALDAALAGLAEGWATGGAAITLSDRAEASRRLPPVDAPAGSPGDLGWTVAGAVWDTVTKGGGR